MAARLMLWFLLAAGCVPEGPPTSTEAPPRASARERPSSERVSSDAPLGGPFRDDFNRGELGESWRALSRAWKIADGELCGEGARNRGVWLRRRIPANARIEFDARAATDEGDIKVEAWGDGLSGATGPSYDDATSYLFIFGGWRNSRHVLARLDEHAPQRLALEVDPSSDDPRQRAVERGQVYHFRIERRDEKTVGWWIDEMLVHELDDPEPLVGQGHDHFAFNQWTARVCFDNLVITPLQP